MGAALGSRAIRAVLILNSAVCQICIKRHGRKVDVTLGAIFQAAVTLSSTAHLLKKPLIASSEGNLIELN